MHKNRFMRDKFAWRLAILWKSRKNFATKIVLIRKTKFRYDSCQKNSGTVANETHSTHRFPEGAQYFTAQKFTSECLQTQLLPAQSYTCMKITHFTHVTALFNRENMFDTKRVLQLRVAAINHNNIRHQTFSTSSQSHCHRDSCVHAKKRFPNTP